ncbi:MAG: 5-formyltetrahydrofolate cyclo-ligase [Myxococcota bacterium]|jgi:5-formyltetrahydrofolate cyclo-ligase
MPARGEVDVRGLASLPHITPYWPRVAGSRLIFATCPAASLTAGTWDIPEPPIDADDGAVATFDVLVVPGLGFDCLGGRLGQGGGFYDRLLATCRPRLVVAVAFEDQIMEHIPTTSSDQRVDHIVTPDRVIDCLSV